MSLGNYLIRARLVRSCLLLERGDRSIRQIAEECGFGTYATFSRHFKERIGIAPTDLLKKTDQLGAVLTRLRTREGRNRSDRERIPDAPWAGLSF